MQCTKCKKDIEAGSAYCKHCGKKQVAPGGRKPKSRGNGQGSVYKLPNGKWRAAVVLGYQPDSSGKLTRIERTKSGFRTKKEALDYLPQLRAKPKAIDTAIKFKDLYEKWLPTHQAGKSTINCYKAAFKHFEPIWYLKFSEIGIDDLQECLDDCPHGKRTRQNMKALGTLLYKYALPRGYTLDKLNYASFLKIGEGVTVAREAFSLEEIELIKKAIGVIPYADYIYCMIYTGFRPSEFLALEVESYDPKEQCFIGGAKTQAGTNRIVTISPKILPIIQRLIEGKASGPIFCRDDGAPLSLKAFREDCFYPVLAQLGITRKLTPHCCRHTFATLMKNTKGADKDKLELMGHTSTEMLRKYQHVDFSDLRNITNQI